MNFLSRWPAVSLVAVLAASPSSELHGGKGGGAWGQQASTGTRNGSRGLDHTARSPQRQWGSKGYRVSDYTATNWFRSDKYSAGPEPRGSDYTTPSPSPGLQDRHVKKWKSAPQPDPHWGHWAGGWVQRKAGTLGGMTE